MKKSIEILLIGGVLPIELTYDYICAQRKLGKKILVCIGNISDNKNQIQAVRAMDGLKDAVLILLGRECDGGIVRKYIVDNKLEKKVILSGFCDDVNQVWLEADLNLFLSKNDGFGLSVIEGFMRGVPCVMFDDLDAFDDMKVAAGIKPIGSRENAMVVHQILEALSCKWDIEAIRDDAMSYSIEEMGERYLKVLRN